ncbi:TPA: hypothetical protein ACH3X3_015146 [Trebouxia sp. C0006]
MAGMARTRIAEERKAWRKNKPFGFHARPETGNDGAINLMKWKCHIPGKTKTDWEGGYFPLTIEFSEDYPSKPPKDLLNDPNPNSPAQSDAYMLFTQKPAEYKRRVRAQTSAHPPPA